MIAIYTDATGEPPELEITGPAMEARELMDKGYSLTALGRYEESLEAYDRAIELQHDYAWAWARKGRTLRCSNVTTTPSPATTAPWKFSGLRLGLERQGHHHGPYEPAAGRARMLQAGDRTQSQRCVVLVHRADVLQSMGRHREAIPLLEKAAPARPNTPE
jgi:tetratricopeptide (TPR) repeat protein